MTLTDLELGQPAVTIDKPAVDDMRLWSVTTIIGCLDRPAIGYWIGEQTAAAAVSIANSLPQRIQEEGEEAVIKWLRDARFRRRKDVLSDTEFGTQMHKLAERYALTGERPEISADIFHNDLALAERCFEQFDRWLQRFQPEYRATEVVVYHPDYGFAGTADAFLCIDGTELIGDYKFSKKSYDAKGNPSPIYPETALQLAAYRHAPLAAVWRPRTFESFRRRYYALSQAERSQAVATPQVEGGIGIKITPDHAIAYPVRCDERAFEAFLFCLECARWVFEDSKTAVGEPLLAAKDS